LAQSFRQELAAAIRLVTVVVSPVPIAPVSIASVVRVGIHDARLGDHDRILLHDYGRWLYDHGLRSHHHRRWGSDDGDWQRQPKPDGNMHPARMGRERQDQAGDSQEGYYAQGS
jgi:hypothetical protein